MGRGTTETTIDGDDEETAETTTRTHKPLTHADRVGGFLRWCFLLQFRCGKSLLFLRHRHWSAFGIDLLALGKGRFLVHCGRRGGQKRVGAVSGGGAEEWPGASSRCLEVDGDGDEAAEGREAPRHTSSLQAGGLGGFPLMHFGVVIV